MADESPGESLVDPTLSPLVDRRGPGFAISQSTRRVIMLDRSRRRLLAETAAAGERCILLTGERTALTHAYASVSAMSGGAWVVRSRHGLRDARSGRRLHRVEEIIAPPLQLELAPEHAPRADDDVSVRVDVACSIRHRNPSRAEFGGALEALAEALLDEPLLSWGSAEPALVPWDGAEVAAWMRDRLAQSPMLIAAGEAESGRRAAAVLRARPTRQGAEEILDLAIALGDPDSPDTRERLGRLGETLALLADEGLPLMATAHARYARPDLLVGSRLEMPPVPMALLLGAPAVARFGLDLPDLEERHDLVPIGEPRSPGMVVTFGEAIQPTNFVDLREFVLELDQDELVAEFGEAFLAGLLGAGWREAPVGSAPRGADAEATASDDDRTVSANDQTVAGPAAASAARATERAVGAERGGAGAAALGRDRTARRAAVAEVDDRTLPPPEDGWHGAGEEGDGHAS